MEQAKTFDEAILSVEQQRSKKVFLWELGMQVASMGFGEKYTSIDQMWTLQLTFGQLASGAAAQPFKTVADYQNWLKRLDGYLAWLDTAQNRMLEGIAKGYVLPKSLIAKVVPQLAAMTKSPVESHLFYVPIRNLPESFTAAEKKELTTAYAAVIGEKVIPAYKKLHNFMATTYMPKEEKVLV